MYKRQVLVLELDELLASGVASEWVPVLVLELGELLASGAASEWVPVLALELDELLASDAWVPASVLALV